MFFNGMLKFAVQRIFKESGSGLSASAAMLSAYLPSPYIGGGKLREDQWDPNWPVIVKRLRYRTLNKKVYRYLPVGVPTHLIRKGEVHDVRGTSCSF